VSRPRILLIPKLTEVEWPIKPLLEEWAEVASFDAPGIGDEPGRPSFESVAERGLREIERRGWERCVVVADELGVPGAVRLATERPSAVEALVLGHACLEYTRGGEAPSLNPEVIAAFERLLELDFRTFVHHHFNVWDPRPLSDVRLADREELVEEYLRRVPARVATEFNASLVAPMEAGPEFSLEAPLRQLDVPLLLVKHEGCLVFTSEGYERAIAAFPEAATASIPVGAGISPDFAEALRDFWWSRCPGSLKPYGQPAGGRDLSLPPSAQGEPRGLVPLGRGGPGPGP